MFTNFKTFASDIFQAWQKIIETSSGGFSLITTDFPKGYLLPAGTPIVFDESTRKVIPVITAKVYEYADANATAYKVYKGHVLIVGNYIGIDKAGGAAYAITDINTSNAAYDVITVGTTLGAANEYQAIFKSSETGATAGTYIKPNGGLYEDTSIDDNTDVSVVIRGTLNARKAPAYPSDANLSTIIFSQSR